MLQQILREMWIDPELLAELGEDQKQTLFCRMREEQVRRWKVWDKDQEELKKSETKKQERRSKVTFLDGLDGNPWTWVMGEHADDKKIEQILEEEAREKARKLAERETLELRKSVEAELSEILDMNQKQIQQLEEASKLNRLNDKNTTPVIHNDTQDGCGLYCSVDEIHKKMSPFKITPFANDKMDILHKISLNSAPQHKNKVAATVAQWERKVMEERTSQIFSRLQRKQLEVAKEAEDAEQRQETVWREQEKKAKEAELQIREIARRAREEHRRTSCADEDMPCEPEKSERRPPATSPAQSSAVKPPSPAQCPALQAHIQTTCRPRSKDAITEWFQTKELNRGAGVDDSNHPAAWFHGLISRQEAERILADKPAGTFLVRISERIWGYAITYRDVDRCKHYLIDASNGHYQFLGPNQPTHKTLGDLVKQYGTQAITVLGGELLVAPCPPEQTPPVFPTAQGAVSS